MERRLLQSSSCHIPFKFQLKHSLLLPRLSRIDSQSLSISGCRRVNPISCKSRQNPYADSSSPTVPLTESSVPWPSRSNSVNGSKLNPDFLERIYEVFVQRKVTPRKIFIILASITAILLSPTFSLPAFAGFHTANKTGGSVAASVGSKFVQTELFKSVLAGFFAGCLQALSGPDHLAALAPLSIGRTRAETAAVGTLWGFGHTSGQVIFCLILSFLTDRLHFELIRTWCIRLVGLTLLVIGATRINEASEVLSRRAALKTGLETDTTHPQPKITKSPKKKNGLAAFATGIVQGLQPDWLMLVWPAFTFQSLLSIGLFLVMFMVGTAVAMGSYTVLIGCCSQALEGKVPKITEKLTWASSLVAICLGLTMIFTKVYDSPWRTMFCLRQIIDACFSQKLWLIRRFI